MSFTFLHSVDSNVALFTQALEGTGLSPQGHDVRNDIMVRVTERGGLDGETEEHVAQAIRNNAAKADLVLLTCSSLSPVADQLKAEGVAVERTDRLLADAVFSDALARDDVSGVAVLIAAPTTVEPTRKLFEASRQALGATSVELEVVLLPEVWDLFLSGDHAGYRAGLQSAIDAYLDAAPASCHVALGQASMGPALARCTSERAASVWTVTGSTRAYLTATQ